MLGDLAIAPRRDPQQADERASHHVNAAESSARGHLLQLSIGAFERTPRRFDAHLKHVLGWGRGKRRSGNGADVAGRPGAYRTFMPFFRVAVAGSLRS